MPYIIAFLVVAGALIYWMTRARAAGDAAARVLDTAADVQAAARRLNFRRRSSVHPADSIEDSRLAAAGVVAAIAEMAGPLTATQLAAFDAGCRTTFRIPAGEARDIVAFGRWIVGQCGSPDEAARRLTRTVFALAGPEAGPDLLALARRVVGADGAAPTDRQAEALQRIERTR